MDTERNDVAAIFDAAVQETDPARRAAYLDDACAGDAALRGRVETLLEAHREAGSFLEESPAEVNTLLAELADAGPLPLTEGPGTVIGRYKLLQQIGEGGFGVVYMAEQTEPVRRRVALKIIKLGMDTKQVIGRFEAERQALAMMDHPNIATVLDGGATETGRPYFVMELVKGIPITEYCDKNSLSTTERLDLFTSVCHAVQHAHQKGIIHRDIKPTNVLVTRHGDRPVPKVIDFGIAKATAQRLTEKTVFTQFRQFIGTPQYMSPEQAEMSGLDVDTRSDIYSLGVLLYELLTGTTPFAAATLRGAAYDEIRRIIREDEPLKPSTQINTLGDKLTGVAKHRRTDPGALGKLFRGDLDWIVMKSLEKDPTRRYETPNDLAADIERHLGDEPVVAGPPTAGYKLRKFIRRNRAAVAACGAIAAALLIGAVLSTMGFLDARHERDRAVTAEARESKARRQAESLAAKESEARQDAEDAAAKEAEAHRKAVAARQQAEAERDAKDKALNRAEGLRLAAHSAAELPVNPGLALLLAIEGAQRVPRGAAQNNALLAAAEAAREHRTLMGHSGAVYGAIFSPDGKWVLTAGTQDGTARIWDARTGKQHVSLAIRGFRFGHYRLPLASASFSPDGKRVITLYGRESGGGRYCTIHYQGGVPRLYTTRVVRIWDTSTGKELLILRGHTGRIASASFSPDGRRIVTASWDKIARIWDAVTGKPLAVLSAGECSLGSATFSPDGRRVLTVSSGYEHESSLPPPSGERSVDPPADLAADSDMLRGQGISGGGSSHYKNSLEVARIWDVQTGKVVHTLAQRSIFGRRQDVSYPTSGSFSPDGRRVLTTHSDGAGILWDADTGSQLLVLSGHTRTARSGTFSSDGRCLLTADDLTGRLWDAGTGRQLQLLDGPQGQLLAARFDPDGHRVVTAHHDRTARLWDARTGRQIAIFRGHGGRVTSAEFSPDGNWMVTASADGTCRIWHVGNGLGPVVAMDAGPERLQACFSPDGRRVVTAATNGKARVWEAATGRQIHILRGHASLGDSPARDAVLRGTLQATYSPDGKLIVTVGREGKVRIRARSILLGLKTIPEQELPFTPVRLWDAETGKELLALKGHTSGVLSAAFSPDSTRLLTAESGYLEKCEFRHNGNQVGAGSGPNLEKTAARVWDVQTGKQLLTLGGHERGIGCAIFTPDGKRILTADREAVRLWDAATGQSLAAPTDRTSRGDWALTPDGKWLAVVGKSLRLLDLETGKEGPAFSIAGPRQLFGSAALNPDGTRLLTTLHSSMTLQSSSVVWDVGTGRKLLTLRGVAGAFSPDGRWIVTVCPDETARIWDAASGAEWMTLKGPAGPVTQASFSPDSARVLTASADGAARIWPIDPLPATIARKPRDLTPGERARFNVDPPVGP